jgi:hypothetical protein
MASRLLTTTQGCIVVHIALVKGPETAVPFMRSGALTNAHLIRLTGERR